MLLFIEWSKGNILYLHPRGHREKSINDKYDVIYNLREHANFHRARVREIAESAYETGEFALQLSWY